MGVINDKYYLYRHIRLDKNEPFYIGIGTKLRHDTHYARANMKLHRNNLWNKIVNKTAYEIEILLESDDYQWIKNKEKEFINLYGRKNINTGTLANLTYGGEGSFGFKHTPGLMLKVNSAKKGIKWKESTRKKREIYHKNNRHSDCKKVCQYTLEGNLISEFDSISDAALAVGTKGNNITEHLRGKNKTAAGFIFKYKL